MSIVKNLNGAQGSYPVPVDFQRFPHPRPTGQGIGIEDRRKQGGATKILWIGYPPGVQIHQQRLYNALILFGEIEWIKSFPSRHGAFVEFRSVEEARRAKDGLQGRLFNDPRIQILYSNGEIGPVDDPKVNSTFMTRSLPREGPSPSCSGSQFGSIQSFGPVRTIDSTNPPPTNMHVTETLRNVSLPAPALTFHKFSDHVNVNSPGPGYWSKSPPVRHRPINAWDANVSERESKKARIDEGLLLTGASDTSRPKHIPVKSGSGPVPNNIGPRSHGEVSWHVNTGSDNQIMAETGYPGSHINASHDQFAVGLGHTLAPTPPARTDQEKYYEGVEESCCWQGTIAKGGIPVCNARCISVGKSIEAKFPEVVNCSARTDLDTLTKHFYQAIGFGLCYFVPERDQDSHPYQEFLHYLSSKNRACVAKFSDGTTIFLVPPSDFSEHVLKAPHRSHIFGVVLKFLQQPYNAMQQSTVLSHNPLQLHDKTQQFSVSTQMPIKEDPTQCATINSSVASQQKSEPVQGGLGSLQTLVNHVKLGSNEINPKLESQVQQLQGFRTGTEILQHDHESLKSEADKSRSYLESLRLAANLLNQLQQKQQQANIGNTQHPK